MEKKSHQSKTETSLGKKIIEKNNENAISPEALKKELCPLDDTENKSKTIKVVSPNKPKKTYKSKLYHSPSKKKKFNEEEFKKQLESFNQWEKKKKEKIEKRKKEDEQKEIDTIKKTNIHKNKKISAEKLPSMIDRLYTNDIKRRKENQILLTQVYTPTFTPNIYGKKTKFKKINIKKSDKSNKKQNNIKQYNFNANYDNYYLQTTNNKSRNKKKQNKNKSVKNDNDNYFYENYFSKVQQMIQDKNYNNNHKKTKYKEQDSDSEEEEIQEKVDMESVLRNRLFRYRSKKSKKVKNKSVDM
jgi:hypothetical protein